MKVAPVFRFKCPFVVSARRRTKPRQMSANQAHHQNPVTAMDVDSPTGVLLKRCSSAPTINDNAGNATMTTSPTGNPTQRWENTPSSTRCGWARLSWDIQKFYLFLCTYFSSFTRNHLQLVKTKPQDISSSLVILKVAGWVKSPMDLVRARFNCVNLFWLTLQTTCRSLLNLSVVIINDPKCKTCPQAIIIRKSKKLNVIVLVLKQNSADKLSLLFYSLSR